MQIDVSARLEGIDFAPKDILTEIIQNVRTIIFYNAIFRTT